MRKEGQLRSARTTRITTNVRREIETVQTIQAGTTVPDVLEETSQPKEQPLFLSGKTGEPIKIETAKRWLRKIERQERQSKKAEEKPQGQSEEEVNAWLNEELKNEELKKEGVEKLARQVEVIRQKKETEAKKEDGSIPRGGEETMEKQPGDKQLEGVQTEAKGKAGANAKEKKSFVYTRKQKIATAGIAALFAAAGVGAFAYHEATEHSGGKDSLAVTGGIHTMQMGETYTVENGIVNGDVMAKVNGEWVRLYDNDPATGLQVEVLGKTEIKAPYGATVNTNLDPERMDSMLDQARQVTQRANPEIKEIETVVISNGKIQGR
jgi:hypothetical protein